MIYYIHTDEEKAFVDKVKEHLLDKEVYYLSFSQLESFDVQEASHLLVTGSLYEIKLILSISHQSSISVGIIPMAEQKELMRTFDLPSKLDESIALAIEPSSNPIDAFYANGVLVLQEVVVGDAPPLDQFDSVLNSKSFIDRVNLFFTTIKKVKRLKHTQIKIIDSKSNEYRLSAVGVVAIGYNNNTFASKLIASMLSAKDGKLVAVILSPSSILQYIGYLFKSIISHLTPKSLPSSVGYVRSSVATIETQEPLDLLVDSTPLGQTPVILEVKERSLELSVGEKFWERQADINGNKDSIKIDHLPADKESVKYLSEVIPFFTHASKEQYASLFTNLREESRATQTFMVLLIFATMIATFGLFINSASVIIGAMLLAPLMQPIVSLSMGVLRQDETLELNGAKTIAIGVASVLATSALIAMILPMEHLTSEMAGRLSPTILDLFVAVVSGAAAAYAKSNEKILGSLAGVAIAVALVPPIAVAGIGLGWGDWSIFSTAFLLFITNLVGIVFAGAFTFAILGYSPLHLAKKGIAIWLFIVALVAIPLYSSFAKMAEDIDIQKRLSNIEINVGEHDVKLTHIELIHRGETDEIYCEVISTGILSKEEKLTLKEVILKTVAKKATVIVTFRYQL
jgi:uncharacterized hydrophobic protein (TIGR00271 family)